MSFDDDASNGTTGAVSEAFVPDSAPSNSNKVFESVEHAAPRKVAPQKVTFGPSDADGGEQFDDVPVFRKANYAKKCQELGCANFGGKCPDHGKMVKTCKVKDCPTLRNRAGGFCDKHYEIHGKPKDAAASAKVGHAQHTKAAAAEASGARKAPPPLGQGNAEMLMSSVVLSMTVESYRSTMHQKFKEVENADLSPAYAANQVFGGYCAQLDQSGGSFLRRMGKHGAFKKLSREDALKSIKHDISGRKQYMKSWGDDGQQINASGKKQARKDSVTGPNKKQKRDGYVRTSNDLLLSKRDDETYKKRIEQASKKLWEEDGDPKAKANQFFDKWVAERKAKGGKLLKGSPAGRSSRIATKTEAIQKILQDLRSGMKKASSGKESAPTNCNETGDKQSGPPKKLSSTRSSKGKSSYPEQSPREYLAGYICSNILRMHPEVKAKWAMKRQCKGVGEDIWTASRVGEEEQFVGSDAILNEAYLSGLYDEFVVGEVEGWDKLERAGIQEDPYCIFSDELKRERKRRKAAAKARSNGKSEPADDTSQLSHGSALIQDDDGETPQKKKEASFFNSEEKAFKAALKDIASRYKSAKAGNTTDSQDFYGYLLQYFKSKASKNELTLGPDKDMIAGAVKEFEDAMEEVTSTEESDPLFGTYREMATAIIARCKDKLPLA